MFILKIVKVLCFHAVLKVLNLNELRARNCTKIVQNPECIVTIENAVVSAWAPLQKAETPATELASEKEDLVIYRKHYMTEVMNCQAKNPKPSETGAYDMRLRTRRA
jgi:hypothetical protein